MRIAQGMLSGTGVWLLVLVATLATAQQPTELECPSSLVSDYALALLDGLYANGLITFESLLVALSASERGYLILSDLAHASASYVDGNTSSARHTLLVPSDAAFALEGYGPASADPPGHWGGMGPDDVADFFQMHVLVDHWGAEALPADGNHAVAKSLFTPSQKNARSTIISVNRNISTAGGRSEGDDGGASDGPAARVVLRRGERGVVVKTPYGDVASWAEQPSLAWLPELAGLSLLPIDHSLALLPNLSIALSIPSTTRSPHGLPQLISALEQVGGTDAADSLTEITHGGLTFFAPVDDAWTETAWAQVRHAELGKRVLGNHYTNNETIFSSTWTNTTQDGGAAELTVMTGQTLRLAYSADGGHTVTLGNQTARILRSDIVLENGVLHIIEEVLLVPSGAESDPLRSTRPAPPTRTRTVVAESETAGVGGDGVAANPLPISASGRERRLGRSFALIAAVFALAGRL